MLTLTRISPPSNRKGKGVWILESRKGILACVHGLAGRAAVEAAIPSMPFKGWWSIEYQRNAVRGHLRACGVALSKHSD